MIIGFMDQRCVVFVHAHPDDESLATGGTIARYASEGAHVVLVTCTNGEAGEIADVSLLGPDLGSPDELKTRLGEVRRTELIEACKRLGGDAPPGAPSGSIDLRMLGYHDSGMDGTPENDAAVAFVNQDFEGVVAKIVAILEETCAQVVVTYNEFGTYGHPDHIRAHRAALEAADLAGVKKVYCTAFPKSLMRTGREMAGQLGVEPDEFFSDEEVERIGDDDETITTVIDCSSFVEQKFAALEAHRTQLGTTQMFLQIPPEFRGALSSEYYVLAKSDVSRSERRPQLKESDLFEGL